MMNFKCETCGKEFTSETEYKEHQILEQLLQANRSLTGVVAWIGGELRLMNIFNCIKSPVTEEAIRDASFIHEKLLQSVNKVTLEINEALANETKNKDDANEEILDNLGKQIEKLDDV